MINLAVGRQPALTTGLPLFLVLVYIVMHSRGDGVSSLALGREQFLHPSFDLLNRLSFYPIAHLNVLHLAFNLVALFPLTREFELEHGTVRLGVVLNVLSVLPGLVYCVVVSLLGIDHQIIGASGWAFALLGWQAWKYYLVTPNLPYFKVPVPTWTLPIVILLVTAVLFPFSSLLGHAICLAFGYLLALGYLGFAVDGTSKAVRWIETRIEVVIGALARIVVWIKETDVRPVDEGHLLGSV